MNVEENPDNVEKINVSFRLIGEENLGSDFVLTKDTKNTYQTWIPEKEYEVKLGSTVGDVFKQALDDNGLKYRGWENGYISTIQSPEGYWLGEFTNGKYSGWMYTVNGSHPSLGLNEYKLIGDEEIVWHYVDDYRQEVADWSESDKTGDGSLYNRWLDAKDTDSIPKPTPTVHQHSSDSHSDCHKTASKRWFRFGWQYINSKTDNSTYCYTYDCT